LVLDRRRTPRRLGADPCRTARSRVAVARLRLPRRVRAPARRRLARPGPARVGRRRRAPRPPAARERLGDVDRPVRAARAAGLRRPRLARPPPLGRPDAADGRAAPARPRLRDDPLPLAVTGALLRPLLKALAGAAVVAAAAFGLAAAVLPEPSKADHVSLRLLGVLEQGRGHGATIRIGDERLKA